jgi:hypothetical protein
VSDDFVFWSQFIKVNSKTGVVTISHSANPKREESNYLIYFIVHNLGGQENYKPINITVKYPGDNAPPVFETPLSNSWEMTIYEDD